MVGFCPIEDAYGGMPKEVIKQDPSYAITLNRDDKSPLAQMGVGSVEFYDVEGVMDSELGYMVVLFVAGVSVMIIKDIIQSY
jgi:hypothetical protein